MVTKDPRRHLRVDVHDGAVDLSKYPTRAIRFGPGSKKHALEDLADLGDELAELQERLYACATAGDQRSVLLVLQGMDTAGKGGVIDHVVGLVGPGGTHIHAFKKPTPDELDHEFLWRVRRELPAAGMIGVFDRSHYEDVLVPVVHGQLADDERLRRYRVINDFESEIAAAGTTVIKCFLNVSYDEQRDRLLARLDDPTKQWKFDEGDITERRRWTDYQRAYAQLLAATSTGVAPWYIVPSDRKWYRNWVIAAILLHTLRDLDPHYPQLELDIPDLRRRLAPPN